MTVETNKVVAAQKARVIKTWEERKEALTPKVRKALDSGDPQAVIDALPPLQKRFVEEYVVDFNASQACVRAGYNAKEPNKMGYQLLSNPAIRFAIDAVLLERAKNVHVDQNYVLRKLVRTIETAEQENNHTAVLRGAELLAKHLGMFIDRTEISGKDGEAIKYQKVTEDADAFTRSIASLAQRGGTQGDDGEAGS